MRTIVSLIAVSSIAPLAFAQWSCPYRYDLLSSSQNQDPTPQDIYSSPSGQYSLQGIIGSKTVRMYLSLAGPDSDGLFYALEGDWTPVFLFGSWKPGGFDFSGESKNQKPLGRLRGQLTDNVFLGQWTPTGGEHAEPVRLSVVPKTGCEGKGKWTRFDSPKWPFSISYPASWRLVEEHYGSGDYIRLICPDPEAMAYDTDLTIKEAVGKPTEESGLVRCGKSWRYGANCGDDIKDSALSHIPAQSLRHGMRILDISDREWRMYCRNGGYVGQGDGKDRVILLQNGWIRITREGDDSGIVGRILDTIRAHTAK
jgi:hypothetical protein